MYSTIERGTPHSVDYRVYLTDGNGPISAFHDIPCFADKENQIYNMIVEIPRWTNAVMEIATKEPLNPIKQDTKKGILRYAKNVFPHHGYIWNYGAIPQTWEDPHITDDSTGFVGDNDPIDICEIGQRIAMCGEVFQVKILGAIALIDENETDWKILAIEAYDPMAKFLNDIDDLDKYMPGYLRATIEWFRLFKVPVGKIPNRFGLDGEAKNRVFAEKLIAKMHASWKKLVKNPNASMGLSCSSVTVEGSPYRIGACDSYSLVYQSKDPIPAQETDPMVNKWHFVQDES